MKEQIIEYKLSKSEYVDIQTYYMLRKSNIVKFCVVLFVIGIILIISNLISGVRISGAWILVAFPIPYLAYVIFKIRNIAYGLYANDIKEWKVYINKKRVKAVAVKKNKEIETPWEGVFKVWKTKKYIFVFLSKSVYFAFPIRAIKNMDDIIEYIDINKKLVG